jgi:hypothetical protein
MAYNVTNSRIGSENNHTNLTMTTVTYNPKNQIGLSKEYATIFRRWKFYD